MRYSVRYISKEHKTPIAGRMVEQWFGGVPVTKLEDAEHQLRSINEQGFWGYVWDTVDKVMMTFLTGPGGKTASID
jgi:hypothetical protein